MGKRRLDIGVVINVNQRACADIYRGIRQYVSQHGLPWNLHKFSPKWSYPFMQAPLPSDMDAYIGHIDNSANRLELETMNLPVVNTSDMWSRHQVPSPFHEVTIDRPAMGRQVGEYLVSLGIDQVTLFYSREPTASDVESSLLNVLSGAHISVSSHVLVSPDQPEFAASAQRILVELPSSMTIIALDEAMAEAILENCRALDRDIPGELLLVSASPDGLICDACVPSITHVRFPFRRVGAEAVRLLQQVLETHPDSPIYQRIAPGPIASRASTAIRATGEPNVDIVLRWISAHSDQPISVGDAVSAASVGRRALERRFLATVGHTIRQEIEASHLRRARELLETTDLSVTDITARSGFSTPSRLGATFKKATGMTPTNYRAQMR